MCLKYSLITPPLHGWTAACLESSLCAQHLREHKAMVLELPLIKPLFGCGSLRGQEVFKLLKNRKAQFEKIIRNTQMPKFPSGPW